MTLAFLAFLSSGLFLGWSLGANDGANIFGTAVGTRMLKFKTAAVIASVFVILGAVYGGSGASQTLNDLGEVDAMAGAFMVVLAAALTVYWMTKAKIAVSTSQAVVGALVGWNIYADKTTNISVLGKIAGTWVFCPILAATFAIILFFITTRLIRWSSISLLTQDKYTRIGLALAGAFGAYALGANNIANVMGIFVPSNQLSGISISGEQVLNPTQTLFLLGSIAIAVGIVTYSKKLMDAVGKDIVEMSPTAAWVVVVSQALVLFVFASPSLHGFLQAHNFPVIPLVPVSSSQAVIGAVLGIGLIKGRRRIKWAIIRKMIIGWIATPIVAAVVCFISLFFLQNVFDLSVCGTAPLF